MLSMDTVKEMLDREPFVPFRIITTSGDRYEVLDPHLIAIGASQLFYCYPRSDRSAFIPLSQISSVETVAHAA